MGINFLRENSGKLWEKEREKGRPAVRDQPCVVVFYSFRQEPVRGRVRRVKMDTRQKAKEKENEKDVAPGERTPKVSGVDHEPSDIAGGWSVRVYGPVCFSGFTHLHFTYCLASILLVYDRVWWFRHGNTESRPWPVQEWCPWPMAGLNHGWILYGVKRWVRLH